MPSSVTRSPSKKAKSPKKSSRRSPSKKTRSPRVALKAAKPLKKSTNKSPRSTSRVKLVKAKPLKSLKKSRKDRRQPLTLLKKDSKSLDFETKCIKNSKLPLKIHQKKVVAYLFPARGAGHRGAIAVHQVGSGKTLTAVTASQCFLERNPTSKVIVITPTSLQANFKKEIDAYGGSQQDPRYEFYTFTGFLKGMEDRSIKCKDCFLIVDEAHNIRNSEGRIAQSVLKASQKAQKVLLLTATPVVNSIYDLAVMEAIVSGKQSPMSDEAMDELLEHPSEFKKVFECLFSVYNTRSKATASEYPEVVEKTVTLKMNPAFMAEYNKVQNKETKMFKGANYEVFYNGLRRAVNSIKKEHSPKVDFIIDTIVEGLSKNPRNKALVFSHFIESGMKLVTKRLDQLKIPYAHIDGSMTKKKRQEAVQLYNENMIKVLLISKAGGEGLDLKGTRQIFIMEPAWNSTTVEQVIGRGVRYRSHAHLPQSERKVHIYRLLMLKPKEKERFHYLTNLDMDKFRSKALDEEGQEKLIYSVDLYLYMIAKSKEMQGNKLISKLKRVSIEQGDC